MTSFVDVHLHPPLQRFLRSTLGLLAPDPAEGGPEYRPAEIDDVADAYRS